MERVGRERRNGRGCQTVGGDRMKWVRNDAGGKTSPSRRPASALKTGGRAWGGEDGGR